MTGRQTAEKQSSEGQIKNGQPRLRLLGLVPMDFQAPAVERSPEPLAVHRGDRQWLLDNTPCVTACPLMTDVPRYVALVAEGRFSEAFAVNRESNLFPSMLCLVCPRPCETACRRGLLDAPVAIRHLKRAAVEYGQEQVTRVKIAPRQTGKRVAVIGSGPAGMAAALTLGEWGHDVAVYEGEAMGGILASAIPTFRLPRDVVQEQWQALREAGIEVQFPVQVGTDLPLECLLSDYDAVLLAAGCQKPALLNLPGGDLPGVHTGLGFMKRLARKKAPPLGKRVVVVGAGLVGLDCARSALRLGAESVVVIDILPEHLLPYDPEERTTAREEGIQLLFETRVNRIVGRDRVEGLETANHDSSRDGQTASVNRFWPADSVIIDVGQRPAPPHLEAAELPPAEATAADQLYHPGGWPERLFAAGDFLSGPSSMPEAHSFGLASSGRHPPLPDRRNATTVEGRAHHARLDGGNPLPAVVGWR